MDVLNSEAKLLKSNVDVSLLVSNAMWTSELKMEVVCYPVAGLNLAKAKDF
jgi:hypothetical protein